MLDFTPQIEGGSPFICLNRLNQVHFLSLLINIIQLKFSTL